MDTVLKIIPLVVVLVLLLPPFRFHVLLAGLVGGVIAAAVGGLTPEAASGVFFDGLVQIMSITSVMMFAATALVLSKAGATAAMLEIIQRIFKTRVELVAAGMILIQALAAYAAGTGAANTLVTAPLIFAVTGFVPALVAAHGIVSGASWATSPSSAEAAFISEQMGMTVQEYAAFMRPYTVVLWVIGIVLAWYGVWRYRRAGRLAPPAPEDVTAGADEPPSGGTPTPTEARPAPPPWRMALPFLVFVLLILVGPLLNSVFGMQVFTNLTIPLIVLAIAVPSMRLQPNRMGELFIDGGMTILRYLFMVGLFLGFINMLAEAGTFEAIAGLMTGIPALITVGALVAAFLIAIPAAAYTVAIDTLIIPVLAAAGVSPMVFGFVGVAVAQGAMLSPVQINVAATAHGFRRDLLEIIRNNIPYMVAAFLLTLAVASVVAAVSG